MKLSTKIILPIILISALLILLAGCFGIPDDSPGYTPGSITGRIMIPVDCSDCLTDGDCIPPKSISDLIPSHWVPAEEAIVTVIPHATLTDEDGYYTLTNVEPGVYYVITATYKNLVLKDVVEPDGVEAGKTYDAGTANCESTALALVVEYFWDMELDAEEIEVELADYIMTDKFAELVDTVCCIIEDCDNITNYCCLVECDDPGYTPELESITVNTGSMNLCLGFDQGLPPVSVIAHYTEGEPSKIVTSSATITYTSNDPSIASLSGTTVTGEALGATYINVSATYTEGEVTESATGTIPVNVIDCSVTYTLTMVVNPVGTGTTTPSVGGSPHTYPENEVVALTATADSGYQFVNWTGDVDDPNSDSTTVTMDANKTVTANFARENIITSINIAGWENAGCNPNFDHPHEPYNYIETDPSGITGTISLQWLTVTNPNLKSVHFFANVDDGDVVTYEYTTDMNGLVFDGPFTLGGGYVSSKCIEIPGAIESPPVYPTDFYIKIYVNDVLTCTINIW